MDANEKIIHGTYSTEDEAISEIRRLNDAGYTKDQITVFSNNRDRESYDASEENPKREEGSFDATNEKPRNEEGAFDITDEDSRERSEHGSFDIADKGQGVNDNKSDRKENNDKDDSIWESVKDFFTPDTYDYEKESQNPEYDPNKDMLYPYREDLSRGHHIVVLNNKHSSSGPGNI